MMRTQATGAFMAALVMLAGCQTAGEMPVALTSAEPAADAQPAEQIAYALARASQADAAGDTRTLADMLARIDALGARPASAAEEQLLDGWQQRADPGAPPLRGRLHGPGFQTGWIAPGSAVDIEQTFLSGQRASIALEATSGPPLALAVEDGNAHEICAQASRRSTCRWVPVFTQRHRIRLANPGPGRAHYHLVME